MDEQLNKDQVQAETKENNVSFVDEFDDLDIEKLIPTMNVTPPALDPPKPCIVSDDDMLGMYKEIMDECRDDRESISEVIGNFLEMVTNEGDASTSTKESLVNLIKIKSDIADKKIKVADLMTRIVLKDKNTFPPYLAAQQNNKVVIETGSSKREMIKRISKLQGGSNEK